MARGTRRRCRAPPRVEEVVPARLLVSEQVAPSAPTAPYASAAAEQPDAPSERRAALEAQREPERRREPPAGARAARARADSPAPMSRRANSANAAAAGATSPRGRRERPPPLTRERPHRLPPADRRQPRQRPLPTSPAARSTYAAPIVAPAIPYIARALGQLRREMPTAPNTSPRRRTRRRARASGRQRLAEADRPARRAPDGTRRPATTTQRRGEGRVAADRRRADELVAAGLLLGAGVAPDEKHAHQRDDRARTPPTARRPGRRRVLSRAAARHRDERGLPASSPRLRARPRSGRASLTLAARRPASTISASHTSDQPGRAAGRSAQRPVPARLMRRLADEVVAVVAQEQLLKRRRLAGQGADAEARRAPRAPRRGGSCRPRSAPGRPRRRGRARRRARSRPVGAALGLGDDRGAGQVAQLGQRAGLDRTAGADDADPVAQRLDLGEDVARQQHGAPARSRLLDAGLEHRLHQRVEARTSARRGRAARRRRRARRRARPSAGCPSSTRGPSSSGRARSARAAPRGASGPARRAAGRAGRSPRRR